VVVEDFIIPLPVSDETPSQRTRRDVIADDTLPQAQRGWLSRADDRRSYIFDSIDGDGSFVYMINTGLNDDHTVSNFFRFVGLFKHQN
jgi:hypothetical protein